MRFSPSLALPLALLLSLVLCGCQSEDIPLTPEVITSFFAECSIARNRTSLGRPLWLRDFQDGSLRSLAYLTCFGELE